MIYEVGSPQLNWIYLEILLLYSIVLNCIILQYNPQGVYALLLYNHGETDFNSSFKSFSLSYGSLCRQTFTTQSSR